MKNNEVPAPGIFRIRSGSSAMEKGRKRTSIGSTGVSSSLQPKRSHSIYTSNPRYGHPLGVFQLLGHPIGSLENGVGSSTWVSKWYLVCFGVAVVLCVSAV